MPDQTDIAGIPTTSGIEDELENGNVIGEEPKDQYDELLRAATSGLLLSINNEANSALPTGELKVIGSRPFETSVSLVDEMSETYYRIHRNQNDDLVYGKVTNDGVSYEDDVVTLEILGIDDT